MNLFIIIVAKAGVFMLNITDVRSISGDSAFLLDDGNTSILYDSGFAFTGNNIANSIKEILGDRMLDYIFLTHSHYDHALGTPYILRVYPSAKVVAGEYTKKIFEKETARLLMSELDRKFAEKCKAAPYEDLTAELRVDIPVSDGDTILCGDMIFRAVSLPGHTRCSFGYYLESEKLLLSSETLGIYTGEDCVIPSFLVGYRMTLDSIERAESLDIKKFLIPHYGLIEGEEADAFLSKARKSTARTCRDIAYLLKYGGTKEEAIDLFKERFYHGKVIEAYPIDAFMLNTNIMIDLIIREILS